MKYVVICTDMGEWYLTTRRVFDGPEAEEYMKTINPSRTPRMVGLESFITLLPKGVKLEVGR